MKNEYDKIWEEITELPADGVVSAFFPKNKPRRVQPIERQAALHQRQIRQIITKMILFALVFGAIMFALGVVIGSYGSLRVIEELMK